MTRVVPQFSKDDLPASTGGYAVETERLARRFGTVTALDGVTLNIRQGEFFSLLGPSGCGKTTLLRIIAGLESADEGTLKITGNRAEEIPPHLRPVNTVFQNYALFPHLNVWDNVAFGLRMKKTPQAELKSRVERTMQLVEISELASRKPDQISGGQKQRVALARAIVNEPKVLLLDEPLGALDLKLRKQLQVHLHQLQRRLGITFIYVTHDQDEALVMSDRIAVMNGGKVEQLDTPEKIYETPRTRFVAEFIGSCNLITGTARDASSIETPLGVLKFNGPRKNAGTKVCLAIRPEKIQIHSPSQSNEAKKENTFNAVVEDRVYSGAETQFRLRASGQLLIAGQLNGGAHPHFATGSSVMCHLPASALIELED